MRQVIREHKVRLGIIASSLALTLGGYWIYKTYVQDGDLGYFRIRVYRVEETKYIRNREDDRTQGLTRNQTKVIYRTGAQSTDYAMFCGDQTARLQLGHEYRVESKLVVPATSQDADSDRCNRILRSEEIPDNVDLAKVSGKVLDVQRHVHDSDYAGYYSPNNSKTYWNAPIFGGILIRPEEAANPQDYAIQVTLKTTKGQDSVVLCDDSINLPIIGQFLIADRLTHTMGSTVGLFYNKAAYSPHYKCFPLFGISYPPSVSVDLTENFVALAGQDAQTSVIATMQGIQNAPLLAPGAVSNGETGSLLSGSGSSSEVGSSSGKDLSTIAVPVGNSVAAEEISSYCGEQFNYSEKDAPGTSLYGAIDADYLRPGKWRRYPSAAALTQLFRNSSDEAMYYDQAYATTRDGHVVVVNAIYEMGTDDSEIRADYCFRPDGSLAEIKGDLYWFSFNAGEKRRILFSQSGELIGNVVDDYYSLKSTAAGITSTTLKKLPQGFLELSLPIYSSVRDLPFAE